MEETRKSTKDKILELLKKEASMTVTHLTGQLNITHMAVRKHLSVLENDGLIQSRELKQPMGRPLQIFTLTEKGEKLFPKNYEGITLEFLNDIQDLYGEIAVKSLFQKREERLTLEYSERVDNKSNPEKIQELVSIQNEKGYMAAGVQIDENTYELIEYNCPILAVANQHKEACRCETRMLRKVLQTEKVERISCKTEADNHCKFRIVFN
ncbi:helix-turn-helix transcriptional regulator [Bacillus sp. FJAT-27225]|uniref:helix-turn-helix transcriptional regulator n=1 Tax=Bacillus sp. FJAT-27225 TaxID=1743144 RepID=UPI000AF1A79B|nr:metalloregulator ArsR/SmtB family transcription factor [Bacillus sp. FJAT-27225]